MDAGDRRDFVERLVVLASVYDKKLSPALQVLYFEALQDLPIDAVIGALGRAAQTCEWFPRPAALRTLVLGDDEDHAEGAWQALRAAMSRVGAYASLATMDAALGEAVTTLWGSWPQACREELSPEMWASRRKEFGRVYRLMRSRHVNGSRYLLGLCELQNAGHPEWLRYVTVGVIGPSGEISQLRGDAAEDLRLQLSATTILERIQQGEPV